MTIIVCIPNIFQRKGRKNIIHNRNQDHSYTNHLICQKKFCDVYCTYVFLPEWVYGRANYLQILSSSILLCKLVKNDISIRQ